MIKNMSVLGFGMVAALSGCIAGGSSDPAPSTETTAETLTLAPNAFVAYHVIAGNVASGTFQCGTNEVMIGIHFSQGKAICAALNFGYKVQVSVADNGPGGNVVGTNPPMHGCPPNFFIRGLRQIGDDENLDCVALSTSDNVALTYSGTLTDHAGGTGSVAAYGLSPNMHACPNNYAMVGIQQDQNALFCGH